MFNVALVYILTAYTWSDTISIRCYNNQVRILRLYVSVRRLTNANEFDSGVLYSPKNEVQVVQHVSCCFRCSVEPLDLFSGQDFNDFYEDSTIPKVNGQVCNLCLAAATFQSLVHPVGKSCLLHSCTSVSHVLTSVRINMTSQQQIQSPSTLNVH